MVYCEEDYKNKKKIKFYILNINFIKIPEILFQVRFNGNLKFMKILQRKQFVK